ncbi:hypothetical protein [Lacipirellula parvula]|nr:hypothetical protein [Lacipirellula parvula]
MNGRIVVAVIITSGIILPALIRWLIKGPSQTRATISYVGSHEDIGGTLYPTYLFPQENIVPWRSNSEENVYAIERDGDRYYGEDGYVLFATRFSFPDANAGPAPNAAIEELPRHGHLSSSRDYPTIASLPSFVNHWDVLCTRMAGGWSYALVDDPRSQHGERRNTFDGKNYPVKNSTNATSVVPYLKIGILDGPDMKGDAPELGVKCDRWSFTVGSGVPKRFRVGVMTDGLDNVDVSPGQVFLKHVGGVERGSKILAPNRFVDMSFFDVAGASPGDTFVIVAAPGPKQVGAGVSGVSFDVLEE